MKHFLQHWFFPHHTNNQRAKVLHHQSIGIIILIFLYISFLTPSIRHSYPRVLGAAINISTEQLLLLTNQKRQDAGIAPLVLNNQLASAAKMKADFMFRKDFWAHNAPDGTTPWDFIKNSGYTYVYAGENLARGFTDTPDVINAWMASPEHRENMLSANYKDVGFAIAQGNLTSEKNTILVVEMFGNTSIQPAVENKNKMPLVKNILPNTNQGVPQLFGTSIKNQPIINGIVLTKNIAFTFLLLFIVILLLDIVVIKKKNIVRIFEHNIDHVLFLGFILVMIGILGRGVIY